MDAWTHLKIVPLTYPISFFDKAKKDAAWALTNISSGGSVAQIAAIANDGALEALCSVLLCRDTEVSFKTCILPRPVTLQNQSRAVGQGQ